MKTTLIDALRQVLAKTGWTYRELGERLGRPEATVWRWVNGKAFPSAENQQRIAELLAKHGRFPRTGTALAEVYLIGSHTVELLSNGDLLIDGRVSVGTPRELPSSSTRRS